MQTKRRSEAVSRAIAERADAQHGMVSAKQLGELGLGPGAIKHRVRLGRLHPHHRAVYSVGHRPLSKESRWMAAVLAGGPGAVLSHVSAAELWQLRGGIHLPVDVTSERARRRRPGIRFYRSPLPSDEVTIRDGIAVTTVPRTLFDIAAGLEPRQFERALNEADVLRLHDPLSLDDLLDRYPQRQGAPAVRAALAARRRGATATKSELEEMFIAFLDEFGLPRPEINASVMADGRLFEPDCLWRRSGLLVELDGAGVHATRRAFESDRERDRRLAVEGWRTIRVTWRVLHAERDQLASDLRRLLAGATV